MAMTIVGIDVSQDKLDVHIHPSGDAFSVLRDPEGIDALIGKLAPLNIHAVAMKPPAAWRASLPPV